jgi:hypothetical protein
MVINQVNVERVTIDEAENNPPVARYRDAPYTLHVALESVRAVARQIEIDRALRSIQVAENVGDPAHLIRTDPARVAFVKAFQAPVPERPNH